MAAKRKREFILLSELISKLKNNDYYLTYAKSLALTENSSNPLPSDNELIREMFKYFIVTDELCVYRNKEDLNIKYDPSVHGIAALSKLVKVEKHETEIIPDSELYVRAKDLKKLYANKCIVFPNSLLN